MAARGINRLAGVWKEHAHPLAHVHVMTSVQVQRGVKAQMKSSPSGSEMLLNVQVLQLHVAEDVLQRTSHIREAGMSKCPVTTFFFSANEARERLDYGPVCDSR